MQNSIELNSPGFSNNQRIPQQYTGEGEDLSPPIEWTNLPPATKELALICDDPDAPTAEPFVHWVIYKIPPTVRSLPEGLQRNVNVVEIPNALQGKNSFGSNGYGGPLPPRGHGTHHYHFVLYALDAPLSLQAGATKNALLTAMQGHVIGKGELVGTYERR